MNRNRDTLLAEIATRYYVHDQSQQEIADQLDLSRSNISRLLKEARERGIIEIIIRHPLGRDTYLEGQLMERFGLREAGVVQASPGDPQATVDQTAILAARMLDSFLADARVLATAWGTTMHAVAQVFAPSRRYDVEVVQMMGGVGSTDPVVDGPTLAQQLARAMTNRCRYLHAPLIVDTPATAQALLTQRDIAETLSVAAHADVALVGIGTVEPAASRLQRAGYLKSEEFRAIQDAGGVGDICGRYFDITGKLAIPEIDQRVVSISLEKIANIPVVVGVACGAVKGPAILGALRGNYLSVLVTDSAAAEAVLELANTVEAPLSDRSVD